MFLCRKCCKAMCDRTWDEHLSISHGPCEGCERSGLCADCHHPAKAVKPRKKPAKKRRYQP